MDQNSIDDVLVLDATVRHSDDDPDSAADALSALDAGRPRYYATRMGQSGDDLVAMWAGDAGYASGEADTPGPRHRLHIGSGGFRFDDSAVR